MASVLQSGILYPNKYFCKAHFHMLFSHYQHGKKAFFSFFILCIFNIFKYLIPIWQWLNANGHKRWSDFNIICLEIWIKKLGKTWRFISDDVCKLREVHRLTLHVDKIAKWSDKALLKLTFNGFTTNSCWFLINKLK